MFRGDRLLPLVWTTFILLSLITWTTWQDPDTTKRKRSVGAGHANNITSRLYIVTPTFTRPEQEPELVRLGQTLQQVDELTWIVVEDNRVVTPRLRRILQRFNAMDIVLLAAEMPPKFRLTSRTAPRGVAGRNMALSWLVGNQVDGVLYFADDDNTYDLRLFQEIRGTRQLSMFPVGLISDTGLSSPIVKDGRIVGFYDGWSGGRTFRVDMAGFAVNLRLVKEVWGRIGSDLKMPYSAGFEEDGLLALLGVQPSDAEPLGSNCTEILVWHTQSRLFPFPPPPNISMYRDTNIMKLLQLL